MLDKALVVLGAIETEASTLAELVERTGLPRATAHRLAVALEAHGLVRRDDGRFLLGPRALALGRAAAASYPLAEVARPALAALRDETGESAQLYVRDGDQRICVASLESPHGLRTIVEAGAALPLDAGSGGRVLRADAEVIARGWIASVGEREAGVASVSAPVFDGLAVVAAVGVSGPIERLSADPGARFSGPVVAAARAIEAAAGLG